MPYLNETGLAHYDPKLKEWISSQPVKTLPSSLYPWTLTDKAGAVTCWPVGGTELLPTVDFLFTETGPASGNKGPENPSIISGVSSVNVGLIGKNLLLRATGTPINYTIVRNDDGSLSMSGSGAAMFAVTDSGSGTSTGPFSSYRLNLNKQYTLSVELVSGSISGGSINMAQSPATQKAVSIPASGKASTTFTPSAVGYVDGCFVCRMLLGSSSVATNAVLKIQLEEGDTATDFEAPMLPADANHTLPLGNTYYGGSIDLATGVMTVTKKYIVLNTVSASDGINADGYVASRAWPGVWGGSNVVNDGLAVCEELPYSTAPDAGERFYIGGAASDGERPLWVLLSPSRLDFSGAVDPSNPTSAECRTAVRAYLAEHPLHIVATLETPQTVTLTPNQILSLAQTDKYTPRLNTVYTDASAVQVGYVKSPIREEVELQQAIVAQGGSI